MDIFNNIVGIIFGCFLVCIVAYMIGYWWTKGGLRAKTDFIDDISENENQENKKGEN